MVVDLPPVDHEPLVSLATPIARVHAACMQYQEQLHHWVTEVAFCCNTHIDALVRHGFRVDLLRSALELLMACETKQEYDRLLRGMTPMMTEHYGPDFLPKAQRLVDAPPVEEARDDYQRVIWNAVSSAA